MSNHSKSALQRNHQETPVSWKGKSVCRILAATMILSTAMLGGCANYSRDHAIVGSIPSDYRTQHPIIVSEKDVVEDIPVAASAKGLSNRDKSVVRYFAHRFRSADAKTLRIMVPSGSHNDAAARRVAEGIRTALRNERVPAGAIKIISYNGTNMGESATVRLAYTGLTANVAERCGKWEQDLAVTYENRNYGNFGCATQNNLAAMIANPSDLVGPRGEDEIDAERRDEVISDWRKNGPLTMPSLLNN